MGEYEKLKERRFSAPLKRPPGLFPLPAVNVITIVIIIGITTITIIIGVITIIVIIIVIIITGPLEKTSWTFSSICGELIIIFILIVVIIIVTTRHSPS